MKVRFLVACAGCQRQYDASELPVGSRFHCHCGLTVRVPETRASDASVVRCQSCGGPRQAGATSCSYCQADFTLHAQDLHTVCPRCMARVSDAARFCHHCGTRIRPVGQAGSPSICPCPACGRKHRLNNRTMGQPPVSVLECPRCAGMWLGHDVFETLLDRARDDATSGTTGAVAPGSTAPLAKRKPSQRGPLYRRCPTCSHHMNRQNFGRRSGVVVDRCKEHGVWFDAQELEAILRWLRRGGETRAAKRADEEQRHRASREKIAAQVAAGVGLAEPPRQERDGLERLGDLLGALFDF